MFVYAYGAEHEYLEPCREIVRRAGRGELEGEVCADLLQELTHQRFRQLRDREKAAQAARNVAALCTVHEVQRDDALMGLDLYVAHPRLSARDAEFAAVALRLGIDAVLSTDRAFDEVPGLERIDPADQAGVDALNRWIQA